MEPRLSEDEVLMKVAQSQGVGLDQDVGCNTVLLGEWGGCGA